MNTTLNSITLIICVMSVIAIVFSKVRQLNSTNDLVNVNLTWVWKLGLLFLVIGIGLQILNYNSIYEKVNKAYESNDILAGDIKKSLIYSFCFIALFIVSIISGVVLVKYRQYLFNKLPLK